MKLKERIFAFTALGKELRELIDSGDGSLRDVINCQHLKNAWFTPENVKFALSSIAESLTEESIEEWLSKYELPSINKPKILFISSFLLVGYRMPFRQSGGQPPSLSVHKTFSNLTHTSNSPACKYLSIMELL